MQLEYFGFHPKVFLRAFLHEGQMEEESSRRWARYSPLLIIGKKNPCFIVLRYIVL